MSTEEQREYWKLAQRKHRIKQAALKQPAIFTPRITRLELCGLCKAWHPVECILPSGQFARFSLDSYHSRSTIDSWVSNMKLGEDQVIDPVGQCARTRMQIYHESYEVAEHNCKILMEDPLYRHFPPGLIQPAGKMDGTHLDSTYLLMDAKEKQSIDELQRCFQKKVKEGMDPADAVQECTLELRREKDPEKQEFTVGDLYGKSRAEIDAMTPKKKDPNLTVGDLYGKSTKEILAFEKCVKEKMQTDNMTREEAEKACEALNTMSADRAEAKKKLPTEGVWGQA